MTSTFSRNLQRVRLLRNFSLEELANLVGCSKQAISNYENGNRFPDSKTLRAIANVLKFELEALLKPISVQFNLLEVNYRYGNDLDRSEKSEIEELAARYLSNYIETEQIAKAIVKFENPLSDFEVNNPADAETAAQHLRKRWKLSNGPIYSITKLLEDKGVRVIKIKYNGSLRHEGLSGWAENNTVPVIVVNDQQKELTRLRYTLLHELGHLLLTIREGLADEEIEKICEVFAGSVLIPTEILKSEFGKNRTSILMHDLRRIKEFYGISILAIMVRARFSNLISFDTFTNWKLSKFSSDNRGQFLGREEPERFIQLLLQCIVEKKIGIEKAAQLAGKSQSDFEDIFDSLFQI